MELFCSFHYLPGRWKRHTKSQIACEIYQHSFSLHAQQLCLSVAQMVQDEIQLGAQVPNYKHYTIMQNVNRSGQEASPCEPDIAIVFTSLF